MLHSRRVLEVASNVHGYKLLRALAGVVVRAPTQVFRIHNTFDGLTAAAAETAAHDQQQNGTQERGNLHGGEVGGKVREATQSC